jgi:predicted amidohydrolase YtcJ
VECFHGLNFNSGIFIDNAMQLIPTPPWSEEQMSGYFETAMADALSHGLTSIHDAAALPHYIKFFRK